MDLTRLRPCTCLGLRGPPRDGQSRTGCNARHPSQDSTGESHESRHCSSQPGWAADEGPRSRRPDRAASCAAVTGPCLTAPDRAHLERHGLLVAAPSPDSPDGGGSKPPPEVSVPTETECTKSGSRSLCHCIAVGVCMSKTAAITDRCWSGLAWRVTGSPSTGSKASNPCKRRWGSSEA